MNFLQTLKLSIKNIISNKMRSILTMIGIIIGISSVIVMVAIGNGSSKNIMGQIQSLGTNLIYVSVMNNNKITTEDLSKINKIQGVKNLAPSLSINATLSFDEISESYNVTGVRGEFSDIRQLNVASGRFISDVDDENRSKVLVIGSDVASDLFQFLNPVGQSVKVNGESYKVIGVLESQGSSMSGNIDEMLIAPLSTTVTLAQTTNITSLYIETESEKMVDLVTNNLEMYFTNKFNSNRSNKKTYTITSQKQLLETMGSVTKTLSVLLGGIASISLIVGGIGVMNVMLVSVTERTKEIGIRKALGGQRGDIMSQFLIEALVLSSMGGLVGVTTGLGIGSIVSKFGINVAFSMKVTLIAFSFSMVVGIVFGIFPAYKAAKLKPIDALRYE
ncbi:ABC transporter permease [Clostridium rectalis]|uniref:ABC transporter permease n=1 Tax=Clostridium rectalis TaxID=2040295 RepID=UPI000F62C418|nr:ABC transporter permease [Clostridium rectalis]